MGGGKRIDRVEDVLELGEEIRGPGRRRRSRTARCRCRRSSPSSAAAAAAAGGGDAAARAGDARSGAERRRGRVLRGRPSTPSCAPSSATSVPAGGRRRRRPRRRPWRRRRPVAAAATAAAAAAARRSLIQRTDAALGRPPRHRADARGALSASVGAYVGVGGRDEADEVAGASHFLEHLLFKGTADALGPADRRADRRHRRRHERLHVARAHGLLRPGAGARPRHGRRRCSPTCSPSPALRGRRGRRRARGDPRGAGGGRGQPRGRRPHARWPRRCTPATRSGREVLGTEASIEAMSRDDIAAFHDRWYRPANLVVAAAGDVDHDELRRRARRRSAAPAPAASARARRRPSARSCPIVVERHPVEQAHLVPRLARPRPRRPRPLRRSPSLNHVLGGGTSSRLFQEIREERGLAYTVFSSVSLNVDGGALTVYAGDVAGEGARGARRSSTTRSASLVDRRHHRRRARASPSATSRGRCCCRSRTPAPAWAASAGRSARAARCSTSTSTSSACGRSRPTTCTASLRRVLGGARSLVAVGPFDELPG